MTCCNRPVKELLNNCCSDDCADTPECSPLFDIASPVEGQTLTYSEEFNAFINTSPETVTLTPQSIDPISPVDGLMYTKADGLYINISGVLYKVNLSPVL